MLAVLPIPAANVGQAIDALTSGFVQCYNDTVPFLVQIPNATTATTLTGLFVVTQG